MRYLKYLNILIFVFIFTGCASKTLNQKFQYYAKQERINYKTLMAICKKESGLTNYVVNVNKSILDIQKGPHYFDTYIGANLYMDLVLDPLLLNYDVGICQINKIHLDKYDIDNEDLLDEDKNIEIASKIYNWNVRRCNGNIYCALSLYNTGKKNSSIGRTYAKKVLKIRKKMFGK